MKAGSTGYLKVTLSGIGSDQLNLISGIIFTMKSRSETVTKRYPSQVSFSNGKFLIALTQSETIKLAGYFKTEAQINYTDNSVVKSETKIDYIPPTLATEILNSNAPSTIEVDIDLDVEHVNIVTVQSGSSDYDELENRPQINGVTLTGNKSSSDLGLARSSDIPDVSGLATKAEVEAVEAEIPDVSGLATKTYVDGEISNVNDDISSLNNTLFAKRFHNLSRLTDQTKYNYWGLVYSISGENLTLYSNSTGANNIVNKKIASNISIPKGRYVFDIEWDNSKFIGAGNFLINTNSVFIARAYFGNTNPKTTFDLTEDTQGINILLNLTQGYAVSEDVTLRIIICKEEEYEYRDSEYGIPYKLVTGLEEIIEKDDSPLSNIHKSVVYVPIFKKIICIGDSLTAGGYEVTGGNSSAPNPFYDYSYPKYLSKNTNVETVNLGVSGATAIDNDTNNHSWVLSAKTKGWVSNDGKFTEAAKGDCYIIYLGTNDFGFYNDFSGNISTDIDAEDYNNNANTSVGGFAKIIQMIKELQPKAKIFICGLSNDRNTIEWRAKGNALIKQISDLFDCYFMDFSTYGVQLGDISIWKSIYYNGGHYNTLGYKYRADEIAAYIDYIISHNMNDFKNVAFIGTDYNY